MLTVVETPSYVKEAKRLLSNEENSDIIAYLASNPKAGVLVRGTGGFRKLRWGRAGQGKSGGVRVVYYFHSEFMPLFLVTLFGKGEKTNLTKEESNELADLADTLVALWMGKSQ